MTTKSRTHIKADHNYTSTVHTRVHLPTCIRFHKEIEKPCKKHNDRTVSGAKRESSSTLRYENEFEKCQSTTAANEHMGLAGFSTLLKPASLLRRLSPRPGPTPTVLASSVFVGHHMYPTGSAAVASDATSVTLSVICHAVTFTRHPVTPPGTSVDTRGTVAPVHTWGTVASVYTPTTRLAIAPSLTPVR